jgi:predicted alpha/beta-hydrolase family hydrolase
VASAEGLPAAGLLLLSYPLHPPGKPEKLRVDHFGSVAVPTLFVSGEKDPFGSADEFATHLPKIAGPVRFESIPGNHSPKGQDDTVLSIVRSFLRLDTVTR